MSRDHVIDPSVIHHQWDADLEPIRAVSSGDTVSYDIKVAGDGQVWPGATYADTRFDFDTIYNLSGPVWVDGAEPGDTLQVDLLDLRNGDWGWAAGIASDLMTCSQAAVRAMIDWLVDNRGLTADDAYVLCSAIGDLKIIEVVDAGMWTVAMSLPLAIFDAD